MTNTISIASIINCMQMGNALYDCKRSCEEVGDVNIGDVVGNDGILLTAVQSPVDALTNAKLNQNSVNERACSRT